MARLRFKGPARFTDTDRTPRRARTSPHGGAGSRPVTGLFLRDQPHRCVRYRARRPGHGSPTGYVDERSGLHQDHPAGARDAVRSTACVAGCDAFFGRAAPLLFRTPYSALWCWIWRIKCRVSRASRNVSSRFRANACWQVVSASALRVFPDEAVSTTTREEDRSGECRICRCGRPCFTISPSFRGCLLAAPRANGEQRGTLSRRSPTVLPPDRMVGVGSMRRHRHAVSIRKESRPSRSRSN